MIDIQIPTRVSDILNITVEDRNGQKIGTVMDLVLDRNGSVKYAILSQGGILGLGDRLIPMPFDALVSSTRKGIAVIDIDREILAKAPELDTDVWLDYTEAEWEAKVDKYYNAHVVMVKRGAEETEGPRISH
jgi:sporulation protein YlmC with PRC-barrel domain